MLRRNKLILSTAKNLMLIIVFLSQIVFAQPFTDEEKKILEMQDKRDIKTEYDWQTLIKKNDHKIRDRISVAFFNSNTNEAYNTLKKLYLSADIESKVNLSIVFEGYDTDANRVFLIDEIANKENDIELRKFLITVYSKVADSNSINRLYSVLESEPGLKNGLLTSTINFSIRKLGTPDFIEQLYQVVSEHQYNNEFFAYALNRYSQKSLMIKYYDFLLQNALSSDFTTRMWSISAIGKLQDTSSIEFLLDLLKKETDWRVRVNIVNALGNYKIDMNSPLLEKTTNILIDLAANDPSVHVSVVSWQAISKIFTDADTRNPIVRKIQQDILFRTGQSSSIDWHIKAEAIKTYAKIFKDEAKADLFVIFNSTDNYDIKSAVVESFGFFADPMVYKELRENVSNDVMKYNEIHPNKDGSMIGSGDLAKMYRAFVSALTELDNKMDSENRNIIRLILSEFASSKDAPLTEICLSNLQDSIYLQYRAETCQIMTFDYQSFTLPKDKDVMLMYIEAWGNMKFEGAKDILNANLKSSDYDIAKASSDALLKITGEDRSGKITAPKYRTDFDWEFIAILEQKKFASIKTNHGNIVAELNYKISPFTVQNFVKLGEKGYYNNSIFHRVVPNFVIQGGDPTGTGFGGPGYSIRSELSPFPFDEYTIGMASSGKDTEGSQFFITHSPQPHLDGKYTMFGKVVEGFDVVDKIQVGDVIETITFSASR